jgi:N-methylhydantoinase B/oxoprolinase/acetone carboxylase alpha subunit
MASPETLSPPDRFTLEIIRSYLISTVQEMSEATKRSAYSTVISEALDFTCGLFDARGRMVAQVAGLPLFAGTLPAAMRAIMDRYDDFEEGDVYVISDPYVAGLHQADVVVARPIFVGSELLAFATNRAHWLDVGGMAAGGWAGTAVHVVQEGLRIPATRIVRRGEVDLAIRDLILANVRLPRADWGDFQSQVASTLTAERRLKTLVERHGRSVVEAGFESALEYSRTRFLDGLSRLPDGSWRASEVIEDDGRGGGPFEIRVTITKSLEGITADFTDSDPQVDAPVNCTHISALSAVCTACIAVVDPEVPLSDGFLDLIEVVTTPGTIVHPVFPAPVFFSTADPSNKVCEAVLKAFAQVVPERLSAGSYQTGNNVTGAGVDESGLPFQWFSFGAGGLGARHTKDGESGEWHLMGNCTNESIEIWENRYPLRFEEFALVPDSGGDGTFRGGLGYRRRMRMLSPTVISSIADRQRIPPWGINGGEDGRPNRFAVVAGDGRTLSIPERFGGSSGSKFANLQLEAGEQLVLEAGGGGGFGPPSERDPELRRRDVEFGYTTVRPVST